MLLLLPTLALAWAPSAPERPLVDALVARDAPAACEQLESLAPDPAGTYQRVIDDLPMPPWAAVRAATCLVELHADRAMPQLDSWLSAPDKLGLARVLLRRLDRPDVFAPAQAERLAQLALAGPHALEARRLLGRSASPALRELAPEAPR